jgi:hypothetical protein
VAVGDHEEVHGDDQLAVITQEGGPALSALRSVLKFSQVARDGTFGDLKAEFEELAVDPGSPPAVLCGHPPYEVVDLPIEGWSA